MTVSNLSQAIRFIVANNFLENLELVPGQADEKMIEDIGEVTPSGDAGGIIGALTPLPTASKAQMR